MSCRQRECLNAASPVSDRRPASHASSPIGYQIEPVAGFLYLQRLGERLRLTYGPVETTLPTRLAELVERLARREQGRD
jgi:hypothetical protein